MPSSPQSRPDVPRDRLYRKVALRIMPLLLACYVVSFIDRTNVGVAQVRLKADLGFSDGVYGLAVGLFFVGFILFEVPSNMLLARIGARKTLVRIMLTWGVITLATSLATTPELFYGARFLLGVAEAGFFPGALFYLAQWFPSARRTRMTAMFFLGVPLSGILGPPISGWIMHTLGGSLGLRDWQWLFVLEGLPPILLGVLVLVFFQDTPAGAKWLGPPEKEAIAADLAADQDRKPTGAKHSGMLRALRDPRVYVLGLVSCGCYTLANAVSFWTPLIINSSGVANVLDIGLLAAIPPVLGMGVMLLVGRHSDRTLERRWHAAGAEFFAAACLIALSFASGNPYLVIVLLALMTAAHYSGLTVFYSIPSIYLSGPAAAGGIAVVTTMGSFAAATSPALLGWIKTTTGSLDLGLQISAAVVVLGGLILLLGVPARTLREAAGPDVRAPARSRVRG
ncbi:MFS transporter [Amycolatopsis jiangsuensis]|uniref:D-galactonate transporter n=1 Tax=Amycolatopsis jiangsuensis TaxID=1181879 RepID=A0A840IRE8_9PSEU|nr:MFS transporter [Amycolatopsis jiangsuensis]MBB4684109.1 D-galactonate transporter [Amycolatopsis jiangsuensis]